MKDLTALEPKGVSLDEHEGYRRIFRAGEETRNLKCGSVCLLAGKSVGEHVTDAKEEVILIREGEAELIVEGENPVRASAPAVLYVPPDKKHDVRNIGFGPLRYVFITCPVSVGPVRTGPGPVNGSQTSLDRVR